jgi:hypothetical protein
MMKMNFLFTPRKTGQTPIIQYITIPIHKEDKEYPVTSYPFSNMINRIRNTGGCSSCGRK